MKTKKKGSIVLSIILCICLTAGSFGGGVWFGMHISTEEEGGQVAFADGTETALADETATEDEYVEGEYVTSQYLANTVLDKYGDRVSPYGYTYGETITGMRRDSSITLELGFDVESSGIEYWSEIVQIYEDPELVHSVGGTWGYDEETGRLTISPTNYPVAQISVYGVKTDLVGKFAHDDLTFFPKDTGTDWGNLGTLYLATYMDLETGEKLETPVVQVVSFEGELADTPRVTYSFTDDGRLRLNWTDVEGADAYFVCEITYNEERGYDSMLQVQDSTTETSWVSESPEFGATTMNQMFRNYSIAENDWYVDRWREDRIAEYGEEPTHVTSEFRRNMFCVIAVSSEGSSMMSNCVDILDLQENVPVSVAYDTWRANGFEYGYEQVEDLTAYAYITMADGSTAAKLIDFDTENAMVVTEHYIYTDDDGNYLESRDVPVLKIPYKVEGTPFEDVVQVTEYDAANLEDDIKFIEEREDLLRKRAGDVILSQDISFDEEEEAVSEEVRAVNFEITANSALSEYLAMNMLSSAKVIDLSAFPEAADPDLFADAILEAYYQNPMILGIEGYRMNISRTAVKISYEQSATEQATKQEAISKKVAEIIAQIITDDMTELEKEFAINEYLCATCEYDDDALVSAESYDFATVDSEFKDSFNAYGALINGRCVCAGYAAAFKLLADASGLECVVVTGTLEGNLPHAWNKVRIDGEWEILDVTNNDNEFLTNALLNLPDEAGKRTLTEDSDYVLDVCMRNYAAQNGQREFYRVQGMYYPYEEIGEELAAQLRDTGTALLRTEYSLDDDTFDRIGQEVYENLGDGQPLYGYHWMGVIYLTTKSQ